MSKALPAVILFFFCSIFVVDAERLSLAILQPRNESGDTNLDFWGDAIYELLGGQLFEVKSLRILPDSSINYAFRELKLKHSQPLDPAHARKLGELIEARRVLWSEYRQDGKKCFLMLRIINPATGKVSKKLTASGPDWFQVVSNSANNALRELDVTPSAEERNRMNHPPTRSSVALEFYARAVASSWANKPMSESESLLQKAVAADPGFVSPLTGLASFMVSGNMTNEAEEAARRAIKIRPDFASAHFEMGRVFALENLNHDARDELLEAVRLNPDDADNYQRLGEIYAKMGKIPDAIAAWKSAVLLAPYDPQPHADLAMVFAFQGNREQALAELKIAEHFDPRDDPDLDLRLANAYETLKDVSHYVECTEKVLAAAKKVGVKNQDLADMENSLAQWKARLNPHFLDASIPRDYSRAELDEALRAKLAPAEFLSVTNPLSSNPAMKRWAAELTAGAAVPQEKARRLFDGLAYHPDRASIAGRRTAEQVFNDWKKPNVDFTCLDYALLYVALAREAGLNAYFTLVKRDCDGQLVMHACACVLIDGKALLVDPAYSWFGAPHREYETQDDFQTIADFLTQLPGLENQRLAVKLRPELPIAHFNYAMTLAGEQRRAEARKELAAGLALEKDSPMAFLAQGAVEANEQNFPEAAQHFRQCLDLDPGLNDARFGFAMVLQAQGNSLEAREQFRKYLEGWTNPDKANTAIEAIAHINETLANSSAAASSASPPAQENK
jgi:tetratricopeptide (TPR) repeat protein